MLLLPRDGPRVRLSVRHKTARPHFLHGRNYHAVRIVCVIKLQVTTEMFFIGRALRRYKWRCFPAQSEYYQWDCQRKEFRVSLFILFMLTFICGNRASGRRIHDRAQLGSQLRPPTLQVMGRAMLRWGGWYHFNTGYTTPPTTTSTSCSPIIQIWHAVYYFQHFWGQGMQWKHLQSPQVNGWPDSDYLSYH